ncbi:MAG: LuxR C-terminal-related transcriptional regulator [Mariniblastus sp.]
MNVKQHAPLGPSLNSFAAPYFFISTNPDQTISFVSPSVVDVLGYQIETLIGKSYLQVVDLSHRLNADIKHCEEHRFKDSNSDTSSRLRAFIASDGTIRVVQVQSYGEVNENGQVVQSHSIAQDVSNSFFFEKNLRERLTYLENVVDQLTEREKDVLARVMNGRLNKAIARDLDVSERTVESARSRLMKKFQANTTAELVRYSTEYYLLNSLIQTVHGAESLPKRNNFLDRMKSSNELAGQDSSKQR